jgi:hypothetical protein
MAALVKSAASPKMFRRNYKRMLRQQHGQTSMSGKSAHRRLSRQNAALCTNGRNDGLRRSI